MLQAPGTPMYWSQVNTELGLPSTTQLWLDHSVVRALAGVASGPIGMYSFYGKAAVRQDIPVLAQESFGFGVGGSATAQVVFWNAGDITGSGSNGATPISNKWTTAAQAVGAGNNVYIRVTATGDALTGGTTGAWLSLATDRVFFTTQTNPGSKSTTLTVQFSRDAAGAYIIATATIYLQPQVETI